MWISKKELNARINKAYMEGYSNGKNAGRLEMLCEQNTLNQLRMAMGLEPIKEENDESKTGD